MRLRTGTLRANTVHQYVVRWTMSHCGLKREEETLSNTHIPGQQTLNASVLWQKCLVGQALVPEQVTRPADVDNGLCIPPHGSIAASVCVCVCVCVCVPQYYNFNYQYYYKKLNWWQHKKLYYIYEEG